MELDLEEAIPVKGLTVGLLRNSLSIKRRYVARFFFFLLLQIYCLNFCVLEL